MSLTPRCVMSVFAASYDLKADFHGFFWKRKIFVGKELSSCMWVKLLDAPQAENRPQVNLIQIDPGYLLRLTLMTAGDDLSLEFYYSKPGMNAVEQR